MNNTRILFVDIDDTLLNRKKEITPEVDAAIKEALDKGHKIVIASGRSLPAAIPVINRLGLTSKGCYALLYNGAIIYDCFEKKVIMSETVSKEDAVYIFHAAEADGVHIQTYDDDNVLVLRDDEEIQFYVSLLHIPYRVDTTLPETLFGDPVKLIAIDLHDREKLDRFRDKITAWSCGRLSLFYSNPWYLEIVKTGVSKGSAVRFLADYLGIPMENTVSAGDSENDIPMIEAAAVGCAMKNAIPEVIAAADYITENDCDHSGVAEIIRKFILKE